MKYAFIREAKACHTLIEVEKNIQLRITDIGAGEPIVFVHRIPFVNKKFEHAYKHLMEAGYRVIGIGLRGFGLPDEPKIIPFSLAEQLYRAIPPGLFMPSEKSEESAFLEEIQKFNSTLQGFIHLNDGKQKQLASHQ